MKITYFVFIYNVFMKKHFLILETIIYALFITLDIHKVDSTYIKYLGIILCLIFAIYNRKKIRIISMIFTLIADYFLLVINSYYEIGLLSFIVVQMCYIYFLGNISNKHLKTYLLIRVVFVIFGSIILYISNNMSILNELVLIYFSSLLISAVQSWFSGNKVLAIGLSLFVCCDICVGLHNISATYTVASFLMWVFYLPSQVLIVLA